MRIAIVVLALALAGCALSPEEQRDIAVMVPTANPDGTPRKPEDIAREIQERGSSKKQAKGWDFILGLIPIALSVVAAVTKKGAGL